MRRAFVMCSSTDSWSWQGHERRAGSGRARRLSAVHRSTLPTFNAPGIDTWAPDSLPHACTRRPPPEAVGRPRRRLRSEPRRDHNGNPSHLASPVVPGYPAVACAPQRSTETTLHGTGGALVPLASRGGLRLSSRPDRLQRGPLSRGSHAALRGPAPSARSSFASSGHAPPARPSTAASSWPPAA